MLATLIRHVGDFQLAEDAVQDAFAAAVASWPRDGVPARPGAWITVAARRRAIDRLRRDRAAGDRVERLAELAAAGRGAGAPPERAERSVVRRPAAADLHLLPPGARDAGARGAHAAHARRPDHRRDRARVPRRARRRWRSGWCARSARSPTAHIPYRVPADDELPDRLRGVLRGRLPDLQRGLRRHGGRAARARRAVRRGDPARARCCAELMPDDAEVCGPAGADAAARRPPRRPRRRARPLRRARRAGPLALGSRAAIGEGRALLERALRLRRPGPYQLQAAIAALHVEAPTRERRPTGPRSRALYGALGGARPLAGRRDQPRRRASRFADGPAAGLALARAAARRRRRSSATSRCTPRTPTCCAAPGTRGAAARLRARRSS